VHFLWIAGQRKNILTADALHEKFRTVWTRVSYGASLDRRPRARRISCVPTTICAGFEHVHTLVHRFEESIGGRDYLIEVTAVESTRWRANICRKPGIPTALMPFYGPTADEAARRLRQCLTRAHQHATKSIPRSV